MNYSSVSYFDRRAHHTVIKLINMKPKAESTFWKKEFVWSHSTIERLAVVKSKRLRNVFREYARYCTVHGVQYIFKDNSNLIERFDYNCIR